MSEHDDASEARTLGADYFDKVYAAADDPWDFETSPYEAAKYTATLNALPRPRYHNALEIGCSIGVLTERLASHCDALLSLDVADYALERARRRTLHLPRVAFKRMQVPRDYPDGTFDLTVLSEVGYYLSHADLARALDLVVAHAAPGGHILLVHWTPVVHDYPLTGDEVHEQAHAAARAYGLRCLLSTREERYRLDLFEKSSPT